MSASVPTPSPPATAFTGERFLPGCSGEIAYEHWHRYAFARRFAHGRRVLDVACGEGYGAALLGAVAASVVGVDIDIATIENARSTYGDGTRVRFVAASGTSLPLSSGSFEVIVSFETIEHLDAAEQPGMLAEFARVLSPEGVLVISSPNKRLYSDARGYVNPFHLHELYRDDLARLLGQHFPAQRWYHQRLACWSGIWSEAAAGNETSAAHGRGLEAWVGDAARIEAYSAPEGMYFIVVAARNEAGLPPEDPGVSLFSDTAESELKRADANAREVLRLDALLTENTNALARQTGHIHHLEALVAERERLVVERDAAMARQTGHIHHLEALVAERERLVVERDAAMARHRERIGHLEAVAAERDRQLDQANASRAECEAELKRSTEAMASLRRQSGAWESEKARLEAALAAQERAIDYLQSFRGWLAWPSRWLRQRLARSR
jgi:SAM-dependent methyltransferase